jgi:tetratricopeptide (TPR) repeat protein
MGAALLVALLLGSDYEALIERFRADDVRAVYELTVWPGAKAKAAAEDLRARAAAQAAAQGSVDASFLAAAALLHTEAAFSLRSADRIRESQLHVALARGLVEAGKGVGPAPSPGGAPSFECRFLLAVTYDLAETSDHSEALRLSKEAERSCEGQSEFWLARGALHEMAWSLRLDVPVPPEAETPAETLVASRKEGRERELARFCLQRAIEIEPTSSEAHLRLGRVFSGAGKPDEAVRELSWVIDHDRATERLYLGNLFLGDVREAQSRHAEAAALYRVAQGLVPRAQSAILALSFLKMASDTPASAREALLPALRTRPDPDLLDPWLLYNTGAPYRGLERIIKELRVAAGMSGRP